MRFVTAILELTRIVQAVSEAESSAVQVSMIVDFIQSYMGVDVCSLYLANNAGEMVLTASRGLDPRAIGNVRIPSGKGLVGLAAQSRHPVNVADASTHTAFYPVAGTQEEQFSSFFGAPLVRQGVVIGVLVTQSREHRVLSEEESGFLVTLGSQLALVVASDAIWEGTNNIKDSVVSGIKGAPGIGIGRIRLCEDVDLFSVTDGSCPDVETALEQWNSLLHSVREDVKREQINLGVKLSQDVSAIFDAYMLLLSDPSLVEGVEKAIRDGHHLPGALRLVIQHHADLFLAMGDPYLRARHEDIRHLGNKLYGAWRGIQASPDSFSPQTPVVLVGEQVSVSDIAQVPDGLLAGIVCMQGSVLSHTAVLANALGIPAVMGTGAIRGVFSDDAVIVDGNLGQVILQPSASVVQEYQHLFEAEQQQKDALKILRDQPAITLDGQKIRLYANSGLLADISPGLENGAEGLGLYRTEIPFMVSDAFPSEDEQLNLYRQVLHAYVNKPVYMRVLDIGGDKPLPYFPIREDNPALGWRGIRFCLDNSSLFMSQIRAMLRASEGTNNLHILLPMVSSTSELVAFHELLSDALAQLKLEGLNVEKPPVGIMVEVPAAISQLASWRDHIDFVSIGSNDLSQYLLAMDRNNPRVSKGYDHVHPSVLNEIARIIDTAEKNDLPLSLCGEMSSDPVAVVLLIGLGVRTLSMSAAQLPKIKWLIRSIDIEKARSLAAEVKSMNDAGEIRKFVEEELKTL